VNTQPHLVIPGHERFRMVTMKLNPAASGRDAEDLQAELPESIFAGENDAP